LGSIREGLAQYREGSVEVRRSSKDSGRHPHFAGKDFEIIKSMKGLARQLISGEFLKKGLGQLPRGLFSQR